MTITKKLIFPGIAAMAIVAGLAASSGLSSQVANADTTSGAATTVADTATAADSTTSSTANTSSGSTPDPSKGGHTANGITETLLTGETATKAKAAALAAVPGGTIQRVENDAEGATYEAHMTKADGSQVTVKMDANFKVTATEAGR